MRTSTIKMIAATFFAVAMTTAYCARAADFDAKITSLDGTPLLDEKGAEINLTVRTISTNALSAPMSQEDQAKPDSGTEKLRRDELARHVNSKDDHTYTSEEITLIKTLVNKMYASPLIVSQAWRALEKK